ncbi:MAG: ankyrin repeat domain-containing protein [Alphaproteobacteria bacterium]
MKKIFITLLILISFKSISYANTKIDYYNYWVHSNGEIKNIKLEQFKADIKKYNITDINQRDEVNNNIIIYSCRYTNDVEILKYLISLGANINDCTALDVSDNPNLEIVKMVINAGADVNIQNKVPVLSFAVTFNDNYEVIKFFINSGADVKYTYTSDGYTGSALHDALFRKTMARKPIDIRVIKLLIKHGADVNYVDSKGFAPLDIARRFKRTDIVNLLKQHGAKYSGNVK